MQTFLAFIKAKSALLIFLGIVLGAGIIGFFWYQEQNGLEEVLVVEKEPFIQQVSISGKVEPVDEVNLGFVQGGRIENVYVRVGDEVRAGRILSELENNDAHALVLQRKAALSAEEADLQSIIEGTREEELAVSRAAVTSAEITLTQANQVLLEEIQDAFRTADDAVRVQVDQFLSNPRTDPKISFNTVDTEAETITETKRLAIESILNEWEIEILSLTVSDDLNSALLNAKINLNQVSSLLIAATAVVNQGFPTGSVTEALLEGYATDVAGARSDVSVAITSLTSAETSQKSAIASLNSAEKSLILLEAGATPSSIAAQEAKVEAARAQVLDAEAKLGKTFIRAPFNGVVTKVEAEPGETVASNTLVVSLISSGAFQIESFVPEINISLLSVDNDANVTLDAYGEGVIFKARIIKIDPAETERDGVSTYRTLFEFIEDDERVKSGMTASIVVTTAEKEDVIAIPQGIVESKNGKNFVSVKEGEDVVLREVTVGLVSSSGTIEILSGLSVGDVVVLK